MKSSVKSLSSLDTAAAGGSLLTGFQVLKCLTEGGPSLGVTQVAERAVLPKATTYRVLQTLRKLGYVEQHLTTKKYRLSPGIFGFLHFLTSHFSPSKKTTSVLRETAARLGATVHLSMLAGEASYVVAASGPLGDTQVLGSHFPAMTTAGGRALVAQLPEEEWSSFQESPSAGQRNELRQISRSGVAWSDDGGILSVAAVVPGMAHGQARLAVSLLHAHPSADALDRAVLERQVLLLAEDVAEAVGINLRAISR